MEVLEYARRKNANPAPAFAAAQCRAIMANSRTERYRTGGCKKHAKKCLLWYIAHYLTTRIFAHKNFRYVTHSPYNHSLNSYSPSWSKTSIISFWHFCYSFDVPTTVCCKEVNKNENRKIDFTQRCRRASFRDGI